MSKILYSSKALEDLSNIWKYTFDEWSEKQADKYYKMITDTCSVIGTSTSFTGKKYKKTPANIFGLKVGKHIVFYQKDSNENILIIRILHEVMDLPERLKE